MGKRKDGTVEAGTAGAVSLNGFRLLSSEDRIEPAKNIVLRVQRIRFRKGRLSLWAGAASAEEGSTAQAKDRPRRADDIQWEGLLLSYDHKADTDRSDYLIPADFHGDGTRITLHCSFDAAAFPFRETHWTVSVLGRRDGVLFAAPVLKQKKEGSLAKLTGLFRKNSISFGNLLLFWRYKPGGKLGFALRERTEYDGFTTKVKEVAAAVLFRIQKKSLRKKRTLLIHEKKCFRAQDNGWYLFKHCMETDAPARLSREIFYVIDKKAPDYEKMRQWDDHVLDFMSLRHMIRLLGCRAVASTESRMHDYLWLPAASILAPRVRKKKHIFLQHGVLALKRLPNVFLEKNMRSSLVACVSPREAGIVQDELGFSEEQTAITGYARFDALMDQSADRREILFMPSIRGNLFWAGEADFMADEYYRVYKAILQDPRLAEILQIHDYTLNFFVHPSISRFAHLFESQAGSETGSDQPVGSETGSDQPAGSETGSTRQTGSETGSDQADAREATDQAGSTRQTGSDQSAIRTGEYRAGNRIRLIRDSQTPLDTLMMRCAGLITDYSSIAWDVLYMGKPVIFFQHDLGVFLETSGSYLDLIHQSPGDRTETIEGLLDLIEDYAASGFEMPSRYSARLEAEYRYRDQKNAARIMAAIEERGL